jgi:creatinine amidohydrolase
MRDPSDSTKPTHKSGLRTRVRVARLPERRVAAFATGLRWQDLNVGADQPEAPCASSIHAIGDLDMSIKDMPVTVVIGLLLMLAWAFPAPAQVAAKLSATDIPKNPLWHDPKIQNYLPYMTSPEVEALLRKTDMVIIPVGALEQHGRHGPIGTDFLNGTEKALLIAQQTDVLVAPILLPGNSPYHMEFPGTITLPETLIQEVYFQAAQSLIKHGFRRFLFLNAHGGNTAITNFIVDRVNQETQAVAVELNAAAATMRPPGDGSPPKVFDQHAGVGETSDSLYLTPGLVDLDAARPATLTYPAHLQSMLPRILQNGDKAAYMVFMAEALKQKSTGKHTSTRELSDMGQWSTRDPRDASAAAGKADTDSFVRDAVAFIKHWKELRAN